MNAVKSILPLPKRRDDRRPSREHAPCTLRIRQGVVTRAVTNGIARDDSGAGFSVHLLFHVTVVNGEPLVVVDRFRLECLG
jgi:hypothetical protein